MKAPLQSLQGREIAVIVVIMTQQHERDRGQVVERHARRPNLTGARERDRARAAGVHRIGQRVDGTDLNEKRGVANKRDDHLVRPGVGRPPRPDRNLRRPPGPRREQQARHHPERSTVRAVRIEESAAVKVVGVGCHVPRLPQLNASMWGLERSDERSGGSPRKRRAWSARCSRFSPLTA